MAQGDKIYGEIFIDNNKKYEGIFLIERIGSIDYKTDDLEIHAAYNIRSNNIFAKITIISKDELHEFDAKGTMSENDFSLTNNDKKYRVMLRRVLIWKFDIINI